MGLSDSKYLGVTVSMGDTKHSSLGVYYVDNFIGPYFTSTIIDRKEIQIRIATAIAPKVTKDLLE